MRHTRASASGRASGQQVLCVLLGVLLGALLAVSTPRPAGAQQSSPGAEPNTGVNASSAIPDVAPLRQVLEQSNIWRLTSGYHSRSRDYRLVHQDITLRDLDWAARSFTGRVTTTMTSLRDPMDSVWFDAGSGLDVTRVVDGRGRPLAFHHFGDTLVVRPAHPVRYRDTLRVTIEYHGKNGFVFIQDSGPLRPKQVWSAGGQSGWVPTCMFQNNKTTWDLTVTAPKEDQVISNGVLISDAPARDRQHTVHWRMVLPAPTFLLSLAVSPVVTIRDRWRNVPLEYNVYRADSAIARRVFAMTPKAMELYSRLTGVPYPWPRYAQTEVANTGWSGMETVTSTTLEDWLPRGGWGPNDRPFIVYQTVPHELAHQWFGDYLTHDNWSGTWLSEGFAHFMTGQFWNAEFGPRGREEFFLSQYRQWMQTDADRHIALVGPSVQLVYSKGSLVLEMLRKHLGDTLFWASIHEFLTRHRYGNALVDDWRRAIFDVTGENLDWFFNEWIYGAGHPDFTVTAAYDSSAHRLTLTVEQTQAPRLDPEVVRNDTTFYETPAVFRMPVDIRVGTAAGETVHRAWLHERRQTIAIDGVASAPTLVVFDDDDVIAKTLRFDMPTAWLVSLLARDNNLWNNWWAVRQLRERPSDPAAVAALRAASTQSKYRGTREQAAAAVAPKP